MFTPDDTCIDFVKGFESFVAYPYDDLLPPIDGHYREWTGGHLLGTLTIGYGHTNDAIYPLKITAGMRLTEEKAAEILAADMAEIVDYINSHVTVPFTQGEGNAMASFGFNCGTGSLANIVHRVNEGHADEARSAFDLYVYSKGQKLLGLQRRRDGEQALWDGNPALIPTGIVHHPAIVDTPAVITKAAAQMLQSALNACDVAHPELITDGLVGVKTRDALKALGSKLGVTYA